MAARQTKLPPIAQRLRPCPTCEGIEYLVSREVYLERFRAAVCASCGRTDFYCTTQSGIADYKRVRLPLRGAYR